MNSGLQSTAHAQTPPSYRVFLVEDSSAIRETLANSLESAGLVKIIGFAETADDAWRAVQHQPADAVIIDLHLRAGTGFDLLNRLKGTPALSSKLVKVVLTNFATPAFRQRCVSLGADYFFDKSLEFDRAIDVLDDLARHASGDSPT
jgi:DNA-binding NarL/FixJ family response regulator